MQSEFEFIKNLRQKFLLNKIGDDCAVLPKDSRRDLVITTDLLIEEIDFRLEWSKPEFIGHKSLAVSLSDVAAMGAKPVWSMVSIGVPEKIWKTDFVDGFYKGYLSLAKKFNVELVGGDISKTPDKIIIDSIAAGEVKKGKAVLRSGAKVGDSIFVSGKLGGASIGLKLLQNGEKFDNSNHKNLLLRQLKPMPQTEIGQILNDKKLANSMIDLSDGLSSDLRHLCLESRVGAKILGNKIPFESEISNFRFQIDEKLELALNGGEDFELLFTANRKKISRQKNYDFYCIGEITENVGRIELIIDGKVEILDPKGFRHF